MQKLLCLLALLFCCLSALADSVPRWLEVRTEHFVVITNSSERDARKVAVQFERMRAVFRVLMPSARDDAASPVVVLALKDRKSFQALEPAAYMAKNQLELAGLFLRTQDRNYVLVRLDAEGEHPYATVYHEYTHYMLRKAEWMPIWMNEGFAEFYQNNILEDKDVRVGEPSLDDILYLRENRLIPVATLFAVDHSSPYYHDEQKGSVFYAESWALMHYLEITDFQNKTNRLADYSRLLIKGVDPVTAGQQAFGDLKKLDQALAQYVGQFNFQAFRLLTPVTFNEASFQVRPVPNPEADAVRADVLLNVQRIKESQALLESVLAVDPQNALAHETMGSLKFREHDLAGAKEWYGEAVALDSKSYLAHYYFGVMSLQEGEYDEPVEQSLRTAIKLNPNFAPSYDALAHYLAQRHEHLDEAHHLNLFAVQLEPENLQYRMNTASVLMENQQFSDAINVLRAALPMAKGLGETAMVNGRIAEIERYQTSLADSQVKRSQPSGTSSISTTMTLNGKPVNVIQPTAEKDPEFPAGAPTGPRHTVSGVIHSVKCIYPAVLTLTLEGKAQPVSLYASNYYKVAFTTAGYEAKDPINPCSQIEGMKAKIDYGEVEDKRVAGQIVAIELSR